jgi:hypothetical protein
MERVRSIIHGTKELIYLDFSNCGMDQVVQVIAEGTQLIRAQPPSSVLVLSDFTNTTHDPRLTQVLKEFTAGNKPYVKASASVGITGMGKVLYDAVMKFTGRNVPLFDNPDQAKEWLIAH